MKKYIYVYDSITGLKSIITTDIESIISMIKEYMLKIHKIHNTRCDIIIRDAVEKNTKNYEDIYKNSYNILVKRIE